MNFGKFAKSKKKRLIPFFQLPEAQRKLFRSLKDRDSNLFPNSTPPPSPQNSEDEETESFSNSSGRNPFRPTDFEIDPSIFRGNNMSASQQSISDSILASDPQFEEGEDNNEETNLQNDSDPTNFLNDTNHTIFVPPPLTPPILGNRRSSIGLDGRPRSSSSS